MRYRASFFLVLIMLVTAVLQAGAGPQEVSAAALKRVVPGGTLDEMNAIWRGDRSKQSPPVGEPEEWVLAFQDNFEGTILNRDTWATNYGFDTGCLVENPIEGSEPYCDRSNNDEKEWYIDDAHQVSGGTLKLIARVNDCSGDSLPDRSYAPYTCENFPITSGMISTRRNFSQLYGYFEARMKLPFGEGFWPAFWLIPQLPPQDSPAELWWPPEVDIMEFNGIDPATVYMTHFYSGVYPEPGSKANDWLVGGYSQDIFSGPDFSADFHTFAVYWSPEELIWFVDGVQRMRATEYLPPGVSQDPDYTGAMHLILNLATGGAFVGGAIPIDEDLPAELEIDYVRVYKQVELHQLYLPTLSR